MFKKISDEIKSLSVGYYILAVIAAVGLSVGAYRLFAGLGETTHLSKAFPWGIWISFDLSTVAFSGVPLPWPRWSMYSTCTNCIRP